jgi:hypothetical protein
MLKLNLKLVAGAALSAALLAGCGGSGGGYDAGAQPPPGPVAQTITDVAGFIQNLFASGENTAPIDINSLTLAVDGGEPKPVQ